MILKTLAFQRLTGNFMSWFLALVILSMTTYVNGRYGYTDAPIVILIGFFVGSIWSIRLHAYYEAQRILQKIVINHRWRLLARATVALGIGILFHLYCESMDEYGIWHWPGWASISRGVACALYLASIFWLFFDSFLSHDRGLEIFYVSAWYRSSKVDRVFSRFNSPVLWLLMKLIGFVAMSYVYLTSLQW